MVTYFEMLTGFLTYPKTNNLFDDLFNYLQEQYPVVWDKLNQWYADDYTWDDFARMHLYGWDDLLKYNNFEMFLASLQREWPCISEQDWGQCDMCGEECGINIYHALCIGWDFAPIFQLNKVCSLDGAVMHERAICRQCAMSVLKGITENLDIDEITCVAANVPYNKEKKQ
jgi:hypothetical protein